MKLRDRAFQATFQKMFVYNILFEDSEVDERYLGIEDDSTVLSITGAGCGIANMASQGAKSVHAVDINGNHLALAALKATAAQKMFPYTSFYDLLGRGWAPNPRKALGQIEDDLPRFARRYWRRHADRFERTLYREGLTARILATLRLMTGIDEDWVRWVSGLDKAGREQAVEDWVAPALRSKPIQALLESPVQLLALGVNYEQRDKMLETEHVPNMAEFVIGHLKKLASTDVDTNWFIWWAVAGQYNHDNKDAVPPFLRPDRYERAQESHTKFLWHHENLFDVMGRHGSNTWSHYTLCDAPDWMPQPVQKKMLQEIVRTARPGAVVLRRSVEEECIVEQNGMGRYFARMGCSEAASRDDRSRQYRRVDFYRVVA